MSYIIIVDMRENNKQIIAIEEGDFGITQFDTEEEAEELMSKHSLNVFPFEILDMGE